MRYGSRHDVRKVVKSDLMWIVFNATLNKRNTKSAFILETEFNSWKKFGIIWRKLTFLDCNIFSKITSFPSWLNTQHSQDFFLQECDRLQSRISPNLIKISHTKQRGHNRDFTFVPILEHNYNPHWRAISVIRSTWCSFHTLTTAILINIDSTIWWQVSNTVNLNNVHILMRRLHSRI